jgi:hypothetical protein
MILPMDGRRPFWWDSFLVKAQNEVTYGYLNQIPLEMR